VTLGSGPATVFGAGGDTISLGASSSGFVIANLGGMSIQIGSSGADTIFDTGSTGGNTITAASGGTASANVILAARDQINLTGGMGNATVNALAGNDTVTLGSGAGTVFGGAGDAISLGAGTAGFVVANAGGMSIQIGTSGSDTIFDTGTTGHDTITAANGGTASANIFLASGDKVDLTGGKGNATVNALAGNDTVTLGSGPATVFAAQGDTVTAGAGTSTIVVGSGAVNVSLPGAHGAATIGDVGTQGTDTVTGFTQGQDLIFFNGQTDTTGGTRDQVIAAQTHPTASSTLLTFPDGTTMTLVGISAVDKTFFK
jgi:Ca2+-binding RTX toxin-like protein